MNTTFIERPSLSTQPGEPVGEIVLTMPFEATMTPRGCLEADLKGLAAQAERQLLQRHTRADALPVIRQLHKLMAGLNYATHKKSLALFITARSARALYFDAPVTARVQVDQAFDLRDLVPPSDSPAPYLVLLLSGRLSRMFHSDGRRLRLIKENAVEHLFDAEMEFTDAAQEKRYLVEAFLRKMDIGLSQVLEAWRLPVFVIGNEKMAGHFAAITRNGRQIAAYIHKNGAHASMSQLQDMLSPYLDDWQAIREQMALRQIDQALECGKLTTGLTAVARVAGGRNARVLILEKGFSGPAITPASDTPFYYRHEVDPIIEKVLQAGGRVDWVEPGQLTALGHIALIRYY